LHGGFVMQNPMVGEFAFRVQWRFVFWGCGLFFWHFYDFDSQFFGPNQPSPQEQNGLKQGFLTTKKRSNFGLGVFCFDMNESAPNTAQGQGCKWK
jgi:hypothetical protein